MRIRLHGRKVVGQPFQGNVQRDGAGLAVGDHPLRLPVFGVVLLPVAVGLGPAGLVQELGLEIPVQIEILVILIALLFGLQRAADIARIGGIIVMALEEIRFEGDRAAGQDRIALHRDPGVLHHQIGFIQVAVDQPFQVVGGKLHVLQDVVQPEDRILHDLGGAEDGFLTDVPAGHGEEIGHRPEEDEGGETDHPKAQAGREGTAEGVDQLLHGSRSSTVIRRDTIPAFCSISLALSTISGRRRNSFSPESWSCCSRMTSFSISSCRVALV